MEFRLKKHDIQILSSLYFYQVLSTSQISYLHFSRKRVARDRLVQLKNEGYISFTTRGFRGETGRPEKIFFITDKGLNLLIENMIIHPISSNKQIQINIEYKLDHSLLLNWFHLHVIELTKKVRNLSMKFISSISPIAYESKSIIKVSINTKNKAKIFIPDAIFTLTNSEIKKSLLFFLEVDMGTEPLISYSNDIGDILQKIKNYQYYYLKEEYKVFEQYFNQTFKRFRVLFLSTSKRREINLCKLINGISPSNFFYTTTYERMFQKGLADKIWISEGALINPPQTILNESMICDAKILPILD